MVKQERIYPLNTAPVTDGPVVYWMDRDMRIHDNWAFAYAQQCAHERSVPLIVVYNLVASFLGGGKRQWLIKIEGLRDVASVCEEHKIPFTIVLDTTGIDTSKRITDFCSHHNAGLLVTDFSPLKIQRQWKEEVASAVSYSMVEVDAHNCIPARIVSQKQEFAAYTIRPKIHKLLTEFLDTFPKVRTQTLAVDVPAIDWDELTKFGATLNGSVPTHMPKAGHRAAVTHFKSFLEKKLTLYADKRNDPLAYAQSDMSMYLHYGMISAQAMVRSVLECVGEEVTSVLHASKNKAKLEEGAMPELIDHAGAYLEELVVRRELADNFCLYNDQYDTPEGFADWAKKSFAVSRSDEREHIYTQEQFENAQTHDELWNAAQLEMVHTGKMHGYMRMYWAKKILEWTESPEEAMRIAIYLNDSYELDGRDPNGYAGIAWSIGGVHDRAWFQRPVFGQIRYMARSGCEKKFDVAAYIHKYSQSALL